MGRARLNLPAPLAAALLLAPMAGGCQDFPVREAPREASIPALPLAPVLASGAPARFTYYDASGSPRIALAAGEIPAEARHAVRVHLPGSTAPALPRAVAYAADLTAPAPRLVAQPVDWVRARAHGAWAGGWAGGALAETARVWAEAHPDSAASAAASAERRRIAAMTGGEPGPLEAEGLDPRRLDEARRIRRLAATRPRPEDFGLATEVSREVVFVRADCKPCDAAVAAHPGARVWAVDRADYAAEALGFLSELAGLEPRVPTWWSSEHLVQGAPVHDTSIPENPRSRP